MYYARCSGLPQVESSALRKRLRQVVWAVPPHQTPQLGHPINVVGEMIYTGLGGGGEISDCRQGGALASNTSTEDLHQCGR